MNERCLQNQKLKDVIKSLVSDMLSRKQLNWKLSVVSIITDGENKQYKGVFTYQKHHVAVQNISLPIDQDLFKAVTELTQVLTKLQVFNESNFTLIER
ncbi:MAG: hypothetical protein MJZ34_02245 [Paludibacteraceae bacterium]|nr:hypothetical protein [Paludibacteraceae bacterium]